MSEDAMKAAEEIVKQDPPPSDLADKVKAELAKQPHPKDKT